MKNMQAVSLEAVYIHTLCLVNKNIKTRINKKLIKDSNNLNKF